jgi:DNA-binding response OmpR family regulator
MPKSVYVFDGWRLDTGRRQLLSPSGVEVRLTSSEFTVLTIFCSRPQEVVARTDLLPKVGGRTYVVDRAVDVRVTRIRQKIETDPRRPVIIKTIRQEGYWFTPDVTVE